MNATSTCRMVASRRTSSSNTVSLRDADTAKATARKVSSLRSRSTWAAARIATSRSRASVRGASMRAIGRWSMATSRPSGSPAVSVRASAHTACSGSPALTPQASRCDSRLAGMDWNARRAIAAARAPSTGNSMLGHLRPSRLTASVRILVRESPWNAAMQTARTRRPAASSCMRLANSSGPSGWATASATRLNASTSAEAGSGAGSDRRIGGLLMLSL